MAQLKSKPWRSYAIVGCSYFTISVVNGPDIRPLFNSLTSMSIHLNIATSFDEFLRALGSSGIPLSYLSISTADSWEVPNLNHDYSLPSTLRNLRVRGSSRSTLAVLRAAEQVPSIVVILINGLDSISGTWQRTGTARTYYMALCLNEPISLPALTSFRVIDRDHWSHVGPDLFQWLDLPALTSITLEWDQGTTYFTTAYRAAFNQFLFRHPFIHRVVLYDTPPESNQLRSPSPQCIIERFTTRIPASEWTQLMNEIRANDSDASSDTDSIETLSEASNGITIECSCSSDWVCTCREFQLHLYVFLGHVIITFH
ncbi:hypothetical protein VNI00_011134 [Paramarasmius palmivorus]|uniref:Vomeronasal type 2 receptor n=1 Tax=Paramarasmius palmivorus TaxID=297713 RepID=A0AAW0CEF6_9AGAR